MTISSLKILLADDSSEEHFLFNHAIRHIDPSIVVSAAKNGKDLLEILAKPDAAIPDLIFLDLNMPLLSGKASLAEIRKNKKLEKLPIVIYSTSDDKNDIEETHKLGANLYIRKPQDFEELIRLITGVLKLYSDHGLSGTSREEYVFGSH
jgi:CheY-like chemotaxis protein